MGRGIKLTDLNNGQMGAMMPEVDGGAGGGRTDGWLPGKLSSMWVIDNNWNSSDLSGLLRQ